MRTVWQQCQAVAAALAEGETLSPAATVFLSLVVYCYMYRPAMARRLAFTQAEFSRNSNNTNRTPHVLMLNVAHSMHDVILEAQSTDACAINSRLMVECGTELTAKKAAAVLERENLGCGDVLYCRGA